MSSVYENNFGDASTFVWANDNEIKWKHFLKVLEIVNERLKNYIVNKNQLFDKTELVNEFWLLKVEGWKEEEIKTKNKITSEKSWCSYSVISKKRISQLQFYN